MVSCRVSASSVCGGCSKDSLNSTAIVGRAAATIVVSSAWSVKGANRPKTTFHRYDRRRCWSAFSSDVSFSASLLAAPDGLLMGAVQGTDGGVESAVSETRGAVPWSP